MENGSGNDNTYSGLLIMYLNGSIRIIIWNILTYLDLKFEIPTNLEFKILLTQKRTHPYLKFVILIQKWTFLEFSRKQIWNFAIYGIIFGHIWMDITDPDPFTVCILPVGLYFSPTREIHKLLTLISHTCLYIFIYINKN